MKKIIYFLLIVFPYIVNAQEVRMGIMANPQVAWLFPSGTNDVVNESVKFGIDVGLSIEKYFTKNYAFLTGVSLNNIGGIISCTDSLMMSINDNDVVIHSPDQMNFSLQYIKIPLALKLKTKEIGYMTYFAQIGVEGGVNVKANITVEADEIKSEKVSDEVSLFNAGYLIGGGAEYSLGEGSSILFGIQYQNGFIDVIKTTEEKIITPRVSLLIGIMF